MSLRPPRTKEELEQETAEITNATARINAKIAEAHLIAATEVQNNLKNQLNMRTVCIAQIAATLMSAADKLKGVSNVKDAVNVARHIVAEAARPYQVITTGFNKEIVCTIPSEEMGGKTATQPSESQEATSGKSTTIQTSSSSTSLNTSSNKCPRCGSPDPARHPAMQFEGEVQICSHEFHNKKP